MSANLNRAMIVLAAALLSASVAASTVRAEAEAPATGTLPAGQPPKIVMEPVPAPAAPTEKTEAPAPAASPAKTEAPAPLAAPADAKQGETATTKLEPPKTLPNFSPFDSATWEDTIKKGKVLLEDVKDNTFGYDEKAFYWLAAQVNKIPDDMMAPDINAETLAYKMLIAVPSNYRGKPVTLRGCYMYYAPFDVPEGLKKDVPKLYECTVRELPTDQAKPMCTVVTIENPLTYLKPGDDVLVKGYFYKIRAYEGAKGPGYAPMIIAKRLVPVTAAEGTGTVHTGAPGSGTFSDPYLILMIVVIAVLMIGFFYVKMRNKPKVHATHRRPNPVHRFRLRRPDLASPPGDARPGGEGGGPKP